MSAQPLPLPPVIRIEPASACNLRCSHCPTGVTEMARGLMSEAVFARVLADLPDHMPPIRVAVMYHGGEPLLNKRFFSMCRAIKDLNMPFIKTVTNGMLITSETVPRLLSCGLDALEISIDGDSPQMNDAVRRRAKYDRVISNIKLLAEAVRSSGSAIKLLVSTTQFQDLKNIRADSKAEPPQHLEQDLAEYRDIIDFKATWALLWPSGQPVHGYDLLVDDRPRQPPASCSLLEETITIRADGSVVACCLDLMTQSNLGNILHESLDEIWQGQRYAGFRRGYAIGQWPEVCKKCAVVTGNKFLVPNGGRERKIFRLSEHRETAEGPTQTPQPSD